MTPYAKAAPELRAMGYAVIPEIKCVPLIRNWPQYSSKLPSDADHNIWMKHREADIAVVLGEASGIIAVDLDYDVDGLHKKILEILPPTPSAKFGSKGHTRFYLYNGEEYKSFSLDGKSVIEILGSGRKTTLPPSIHSKTGNPYKWLSESGMAAKSEMVRLDSDTISRISELFPRPAIYDHVPRLDQPISIEDAGTALQYITADDYDLWIKIGMALKSEFGADGFSLWDKWSQTGDKYDHREMKAKFRSFKPSDITIGTLIFHARQNGYVQAVEEFQLEVSQAAPLGEVTAIPAPTLEPDHLISETVAWINSHAMLVQPELAMLNVLAFAGAVVGRRWETPLQRGRSNIYLVGIADTGEGKDHSRKMIKFLAEQAGLSTFIGSDNIRSGTGLVMDLQKKTSQLKMIDEFGLFMQAVSDVKGQQPYKREASDLLMKLYSDSSSTYNHGIVASDEEKFEGIKLIEPNLCIYGTTTLVEFIPAVRTNTIQNGKLNRFIVMPPTGQPHLSDHHQTLTLPAPLKHAWQKLAISDRDGIGTGNSCKTGHLTRTVAWGPNSETEIHTLLLNQITRTRNSQNGALWVRWRENALKIALILAVTRCPDCPVITTHDIEFGRNLVETSISYILQIADEHMSENQYESDKLKILRAIKAEQHGMQPRELSRIFRSIRVRERDELVRDLITSGLIVVETVQHEGAGRPTVKYRIARQ